MLNTINPSIKQHTKATLKLNIPKTTHYIDEVMLHRLGLMVGIYVWPGVNMKGSHATKLDISSNGLAMGKTCNTMVGYFAMWLRWSKKKKEMPLSYHQICTC